MISRRVQVVGVVVVVLLAASVAIGRHEGRVANTKQVAEIRRVQRLAGTPLDNPRLSAYRFDPGFACLIYRSGTNRFALRLCFDGRGRLVETADERSSPIIYGSVTYRPQLAPFQIAPETIISILRRHGVTDGEIQASGY